MSDPKAPTLRRAKMVTLALVLLLALAMIPVGLPGTWVMIAAAIALGFASAAVHVGWVVLGGCVVLAIIAEALASF